MPEQDTPPTRPTDDDAFDERAFAERWDRLILRDPRTGEVDHHRSLMAMLDDLIVSKPDAYWDQRPWGVEFLEDLVSPVTGETCAARFVLRHEGQPRATVEFRPGQTTSPLSESEGPQLMWFLTIGRRKPKGYVNVQWALAAGMGLRRHDMWDNRYLHEWLTNGDVRAMRRLWQMDEDRDQERDAQAARRRGET
jgi:hypothetical protein